MRSMYTKNKPKEYFFLNMLLSLVLGLIYGFCFIDKISIFFNIFALSGLLYVVRMSQYPFLVGYLYGFSFFIISLSWVSTSLLTGPASFVYLEPIVKLLIPLFLSFFVALFTYTISKFKDNVRFLVAGPLWYIFEYLRSLFPFAFPWNMISSLYSYNLAFVQIVSLIGATGVNFIAGYFAFILYNKSKKVLIFFICIFLLIIGFGYHRLNKPKNYDENIKLRVVQTRNPVFFDSIQSKFNKFDSILKSFIPRKDSDVTHVIFPESIFPFVLQPPFVDIVKAAFKMYNLEDGVSVIMGCERDYNIDNVHNSMLFGNNKEVKFYDKKVLVPFGEYIPYKWVKNIIKDTATMVKRGVKNEIINLDGLKILPVICFESAFSNRVYEFDVNQADLIINVSNSAWFKGNEAQHQHLAITLLRAIEYGVPVSIASNNGISANIDPYGNILNKIEVGKENYIETLLPKRVYTFYLQYKPILDISYTVASIAIIVLVMLFNISRYMFSRVGDNRYKM